MPVSRRRNRRNKQRPASSPTLPVDKQLPRKPIPASEIRNAVRLQVQEILVAHEHFVGPLPHPEHLSAYERIIPGAAERIVQMAELQADHRRAMESKVVESGVRLVSRGQIFGFIAVMTALVGGIGLMAFDKPIWGAAVSLTALTSLAGVFVWSRRQKSRELSEKTNPAAFGVEPTLPPQPPDSPGQN